MSDSAGLMHAIHDLPNDDLPRLAFADWLEEHDQSERAEFVRVQIALAKVSREEKRFRPLHNREVALIRAHKDRWFGTFRSGWSYYDCRRGFIEEVWSSAAAFLPHAVGLHEHHALQQVRLAGLLPELRAALRSPLIAFLRAFSFSTDLGYSGFTVHDLPSSNEPLARRPLDVAVTGMPSGAELVRVLTRQPLPARLTTLNLSGNHLDRESLAELLDALPSWPNLVRLNLVEAFAPADGVPAGLASSGDECVVHLARHPAMARLPEINLSRNQIGGAGVRALVESPHLEGVRRLILSDLLSPRQRQNLRERFGDRVEGLVHE